MLDGRIAEDMSTRQKHEKFVSTGIQVKEKIIKAVICLNKKLGKYLTMDKKLEEKLC